MQRKMMKRQRPSSPDIPNIEDEEPLDTNMNRPSIPLRSSKRQRVLPPSLDGPSRGWANSSTPHNPYLQANSSYEDDEDYYDDDFSGDEPGRDTAGGGDDDAEMQGVTMQKYRNVNSLLHDLHAEQQHRRVLSSSPGPRAPPPTIETGAINNYGQAHTHHIYPHPQQHQQLYHTHPHSHYIAPQLAHYAQNSRFNSVHSERHFANGGSEGYGHGSQPVERAIPMATHAAAKQTFPSLSIPPPHVHTPSHPLNSASYHHSAQYPLLQQRLAGHKDLHLGQDLPVQEDEEMGEEHRVRERYEDTNKLVLL